MIHQYGGVPEQALGIRVLPGLSADSIAAAWGTVGACA